MALLLARPRGAMGRALSRALHPTKPRGVPRGPGWSPLSSLCAAVYPCPLCHRVPVHLLTHSPCSPFSFSPSSLLPYFLRPSSHHRACAYAWEDRWGRASKKASQRPPSRRHSGSPAWLDVGAGGRRTGWKLESQEDSCTVTFIATLFIIVECWDHTRLRQKINGQGKRGLYVQRNVV